MIEVNEKSVFINLNKDKTCSKNYVLGGIKGIRRDIEFVLVYKGK